MDGRINKLINWPDINFPPVNLHSLPRNWPECYLSLESQYVGEAMQNFYNADEGIEKEFLKLEMEKKKKEFNILWNSKSKLE